MNRRALPHTLAIALATLMLLAAMAGSSLAAAPEVDPELAIKLQAKLDLWRVGHRAPGVAKLDGIKGIGHGGSLRGFVSLMFRLPEEDLDDVVVANLGRTSIGGLADRLAHVTLDHVPSEPEP